VKLTRKTTLLAAMTALLAGMNLVREDSVVAENLPALPSVPLDAVRRIQIRNSIDKIVIERVSTDPTSPDHDRWNLVAPLQFPADAAQIRSLMREFGPGMKMDSFVDNDRERLEDYGVDDQHGTLVEFFTDGEEPQAALVVGKPGAGPAAFVRIPGGDLVYRADVGGVARYTRKAAEWRDKMALDVDPATITGLELTRGTETLRFRRGPDGVDAEGNPVDGTWTLDGIAMALDSATVDATARSLGRIRSGEIHNPDYSAGFDSPRARATLTTKDGATHRVILGGRDEAGTAFVKVDERPEVFRTSAQVARLMLQPVEDLRDRSLFSFKRAEIASMALSEGGLTVVLAQADDGKSWFVAQPANMDVDQRQAMFTINTLATLRATGAAPDTGFEPSGASYLLRFRDGRSLKMEMGQRERDGEQHPLVRVRVGGREGIHYVRESTVDDLRKAFGRG